jgi:hypothetical protein
MMRPSPRPGGAIYALYEDADAAQRAFDRLRASGVQADAITVVSGEPIEEYEFSQRDAATWLHWIAGGGGVVGLAAAVALLLSVPQAWPIVTGGMPIVAWWPNLVIMFELTMLGAILATVVTLFFTAIIRQGDAGLYDARVMDGYILVGVERAPDVAAAREALASAGGIFPD